MCRHRIVSLGILAVVLLTSHGSLSQTRPDRIPDDPIHPVGPIATDWERVSPVLEMMRDIAGDDVIDPPFSYIDGADQVEVLVRLRCRPVTPIGDEHPTRDDSRIVATSVTWRRLETLESAPCVSRVEPARLPGNLAPLEVTIASIGAESSHFRPKRRADGDDQTIALLDSPVDILHPAFFRPDGGRYDWIDSDGDGRFTPGTDAVDLDDDGRADHNETLRIAEATTVVDFEAGDLRNDDGVFQADRDWLHADMNGDGKRNAGPADGFAEFDPSYSEPTFVADDVDRDRELEPGEPLFRLDSSKIERIVFQNKVYVRGDNLIDAASSDLPTRSIHGTGVAGILVGGQLGFHRRVGVAPRSDLVIFGYPRTIQDEQKRHIEALERAQSLGADVFLSEWTNPFVRPLDGSSNLEVAMDRARENGLVQIVPVGNLNLSEKHISQRADKGKTTALKFEVPMAVQSRSGESKVGQVFGSIQWNADESAEFALRPPRGGYERLPSSGGSVSFNSFDVKIERDETPGGTALLTFYIRDSTGSQDASLPTGTWSFRIEGVDSTTTFYGRITDPHTGWSRGVGWSNPTEDETTISYPATAGAAIGVAAFVGRSPTGSASVETGDLRGFSGRGPRIDGARVVDIAAPDNPFVPVASTPRVSEAGWGGTWYHQFGGTSGAAPHVAGSFALLLQAHPEKSVDELQLRLTEHARQDGLTPQPASFPDSGWGRGMLRTYRSLYDSAPSDNEPPTASLDIRTHGDIVVFDGAASSDPDGDTLEYRFDFQHDGHWSTQWQSDAAAESLRDDLRVDGRAPRYARLEIRDSHGARSGALAPIGPAALGDVGVSVGDASPDSGLADASEPAEQNSRHEEKSLFACSSTTTTSRPSRIPGALGLLVIMSLVRLRRRLT